MALKRPELEEGPDRTQPRVLQRLDAVGKGNKSKEAG